MAQTNDETFLKKGLSKTNYEIISELGFRADYDGEIRIALNKARLAALDDCKTLLENFIGSDEWDYQYPAVGERRLGRMIYKEELEQLLAELEALRKKVEG